jgi:hypothetical protein
MFTQNVGGIDRLARIVVGLVLIAAGFFYLTGTLGVIVGIVGFVPLLTGVVGWCPVYLPFRISSRSKA